MTDKEIDPRDFADRVERLCDFILNRIADDPNSANVRVIHKLKEDAADIQFKYASFRGISLIDLSDHMKGLGTP